LFFIFCLGKTQTTRASSTKCRRCGSYW